MNTNMYNKIIETKLNSNFNNEINALNFLHFWKNAKALDKKFISHVNITQIKNNILEVNNKILVLKCDIDNKIAEELSYQLMNAVGRI